MESTDAVCTADPAQPNGTQSRAAAQPPLSLAFQVPVAMFCGLIFGFAFERSRVYEPLVIREQFVFRKWIMLKMFMGACAGSTISFLIVLFTRPAVFEKARQENLVGKPVAVVAVGAAILGMGMVVAGACPGMVLPQLGTGLHNAWIVFLGGIAGALCFNLLKFSNLLPIVTHSDCKGRPADQLCAEYADLRFTVFTNRLPLLLTGFCVCAVSFCVAMEVHMPYKDELRYGTDGGAFPPSLCGFAIGVLNLVVLNCLNSSLGSASGYAAVSSTFAAPIKANSFFWTKATSATPVELFPNTEKAVTDTPLGPQPDTEHVNPVPSLDAQGGDEYVLGLRFADWWQVPYLGCAVFGSYLSGLAGGNLPSSAPGIANEATAFVGGFMMLFGSRIASGCTSGHGITGMPMMNLYSVVGVCCMFGSGIVLAFVLDSFGHLDSVSQSL